MSALLASQPGAMSPSDSWLFLGFLFYAFALIGVTAWCARRERNRRREPRRLRDGGVS